MKKPDFVYVTYIAATPEKVWQALVDPKLMRQYWLGVAAESPAHENISDWKPGSRWEHRNAETGAVDMVGKIIEHTPPRRLAFTWARPDDFDNDSKHSHVSFEIEQKASALICLTVIHDSFSGDQKMFAGISHGWPQVLSHLKTFLETGQALPRD